jgi:hypothetical protein
MYMDGAAVERERERRSGRIVVRRCLYEPSLRRGGRRVRVEQQALDIVVPHSYWVFD